MTTRMPGQAQTEDSANFDPDRFFEAWKKGELQAPSDNKFRECIIQAFGLPIEDDYGYRATAEVTLAQVQTHINFGARNGLQRWYADENGVEVSRDSLHDLDLVSSYDKALKNVSESSFAYSSRHCGLYGHLSTLE